MATVSRAGSAPDPGAHCLEQVGFRGGEVPPNESMSSVNPRMQLSQPSVASTSIVLFCPPLGFWIRFGSLF